MIAPAASIGVVASGSTTGVDGLRPTASAPLAARGVAASGADRRGGERHGPDRRCSLGDGDEQPAGARGEQRRLRPGGARLAPGRRRPQGEGHRRVQPQRRDDDPNRTCNIVVRFNNVSPSSIVLATLQQVVNGVQVAGVIAGSGQFTIVLNRAAPSPVKVGWFVIG